MTSPPLIFDIRRGSMDDGPGIRSTVFFKGCPLSCVWCHNPESISPWPQISYDVERCLGADCRACATVCRETDAGAPLPGNVLCRSCGTCAESCPSGARELHGRPYPLDDLCSLLLSDLPFYWSSGGGVTLSGGEPALHHEYVHLLLSRLKEHEVHTAIQTCGVFEAAPFVSDLLPLLDLVYFDLKLGDPLLHRLFTGGDNAVITANLAVLARQAPERLVARVPLVEGITATPRNLSILAGMVREFGITNWELLPYNPGGMVKLKRLGLPVRAQFPDSFMSRESEAAWRSFFDGVAGVSRLRGG